MSPLLFNVQGGIELSNYFIIPILLKSHDTPLVLGSTSTHYFIKDHIMLSLHIGPVNPLENRHRLGLGNDHGLIEVLLKCRVKPIIDVWFFLNKPQIFSSFPSPNLPCPCS
jgi:hypothetical protein